MLVGPEARSCLEQNACNSGGGCGVANLGNGQTGHLACVDSCEGNKYALGKYFVNTK